MADPKVRHVILSEGYLRERDGCVPQGVGSKVSVVRVDATLRGTPDSDHKNAYREEHHEVVKVTEQRDPQTGKPRRMYHLRTDQ